MNKAALNTSSASPKDFAVLHDPACKRGKPSPPSVKEFEDDEKLIGDMDEQMVREFEEVERQKVDVSTMMEDSTYEPLGRNS